MAWKINLIGDATAVIAALPALIVQTANPLEDAQVAAVKSLLAGKIPVSGGINVMAAGHADASNYYVTTQVKPVDIVK